MVGVLVSGVLVHFGGYWVTQMSGFYKMGWLFLFTYSRDSNKYIVRRSLIKVMMGPGIGQNFSIDVM
jgi:hypothetical protein